MKTGVLARTYATCGTRGGTVGCGSARMSPREINPPRLMDRDTRIPPSMEGLPLMTLSRPRPCPPHASNVASIPSLVFWRNARMIPLSLWSRLVSFVRSFGCLFGCWFVCSLPSSVRRGARAPDAACRLPRGCTLPPSCRRSCAPSHLSSASTLLPIVARGGNSREGTHICLPPWMRRCCTGGMPSFSSTFSLICETCTVGASS